MSDLMTLVEAQEHLEAHIDKGVRCLCCGRYNKRYPRHFNSGMAISLMNIYRVRGLDWCHLPTEVSARSREEGKIARYWELMEESSRVRQDGGRAGYWRITPRGRQFLLGDMRIPSVAIVRNNRLIGMDTSEMVTIFDCLKHDFDLTELMGWRASYVDIFS